jgi:hypothetical protein
MWSGKAVLRPGQACRKPGSQMKSKNTVKKRGYEEDGKIKMT